jgi:hypothetical protein
MDKMKENVRKEVQGKRKRHKCERILAEKSKKMARETIRMRKQKKAKISGQGEKHYKVKSVKYKKSRII